MNTNHFAEKIYFVVVIEVLVFLPLWNTMEEVSSVVGYNRGGFPSGHVFKKKTNKSHLQNVFFK